MVKEVQSSPCVGIIHFFHKDFKKKNKYIQFHLSSLFTLSAVHFYQYQDQWNRKAENELPYPLKIISLLLISDSLFTVVQKPAPQPISNTSLPPACNNLSIGALKSFSKASFRALCLTQSRSMSSTVLGNLGFMLYFVEVLHFSFKKEVMPPLLLLLLVLFEVLNMQNIKERKKKEKKGYNLQKEKKYFSAQSSNFHLISSLFSLYLFNTKIYIFLSLYLRSVANVTCCIQEKGGDGIIYWTNLFPFSMFFCNSGIALEMSSFS